MKAASIEDLQAGGGFTWGVEAGLFFSDHFGFEASWVRQESAVRIGTTDGSADLFDMKLSQLHGNLVYRFGPDNARLVPFVLAGAGAAFLSADDLDGETKFAWTLGAGLKWFASERVGLRAQARYVPTMLDDESSEVCDPFGFCQGSLSQFELMGGVVLRF
jgi:opacity protein-like surface antigen